MNPNISRFMNPNIKPVFNLLNHPKINCLPPVEQFDSCPICYNYCFEPFGPDSCIHFFCKKCIAKWKKTKNQCPICRTKFNFIIRK